MAAGRAVTPPGLPAAGRLAGLVLAAGFSSRMGGRPKALIPLGGRTLLDRLVTAFRQAGIDRPAVVCGHEGEAVERACAQLGAATVRNRDFAHGMFSSVRAGLRVLARASDGAPAGTLAGGGHEAVLVSPVDAALVLPRTLNALAASWEAERSRPCTERRIIIPEFCGIPGHPLLLPAHHCAEILSRRDEGGLRGYVAGLPPAFLMLLPLPDAGILCDLDMSGDFADAEAFLTATRDRADPSPAEALQVLLLAGLDAKRFRHSLLVAFGAHRLWRRLTAEEAAFSGTAAAMPYTALCAGLLHDVARKEPDHARLGAEKLRELGWLDAAFAVENHMFFSDSLAAALESGAADARALVSACVYLADKYAAGDDIVPPETRFAEKRERWRHDPAALAAIAAQETATRRLEAWFAAVLRKEMGEETGEGLADIISAPSEKAGKGAGDTAELELRALAEAALPDGTELWRTLSFT